MIILGGNNISQVDNRDGFQTLVEKTQYSFFYAKTSCKRSVELPLDSLVLLPLSNRGTIRLNGQNIGPDSVLMANARHFLLEVEGEVEMIMGGVKGKFTEDYSLVKLNEVKKVQKPWGHELWYNGEAKHFALKKIFLKSQNRVSLQYHEKKRETLFFYNGKMNFHYYEEKFYHKDEVNINRMKQKTLCSKAVIDIAPMTVHRMEAISNVTIFEISTPELDDVIRIQDDSSRPSGRIESELSS